MLINIDIRIGPHKLLRFYRARSLLMMDPIRLSFGGADVRQNKNSGTVEPFRRQVKAAGRLQRNPEFRI